ncbi:MAG: 2Fe-2S iron-sulfur cluster binding domain-containing protein [Sulfurimonas sp.]|jgi:ferredoxin|nr:2Fe-2S iron-sulfur cluster binding domain-containing protein [Sulfurimonas sp.]MDD5203461.1 2Fe-2S iron-sulfur cluster binding domain-containing protein [Sulfurimonas sp.]
MVNVIFCGFGEGMDKRVIAKQGDLLLRVANNNGVVIPTDCKDGMCGSCAVKVEELTIDMSEAGAKSEVDPDGWDKNKYTTYMEDKELATLVEMGAISKIEAESAQQYAQQTPVRLACQCIIKGSILVKPFE